MKGTEGRQGSTVTVKSTRKRTLTEQKKSDLEPASLFEADVTKQLVSSTRCFGCNTEAAVLHKCSRCRVAGYCRKECQVEHYSKHKAFCVKLKKLQKQLKKLGSELEGEDYFAEYNVGRFWGIWETRPYMRTRSQLAYHLLAEAKATGRQQVYESALTHFLELLRLSHGDNLGVRSVVPLVLIAINEDQRAYDFIKWWQTIDPNGTYDWGSPPPSVAGQWLYLRGEDLFEDVLEVDDYFDLQFLAALALLKLRVLCAADLDKERCKIVGQMLDATETCKSGESQLLATCVEQMLTGGRKWLRKQQRMATRYLRQLVANNETFAKAIVNPMPLMSKPLPGSFSNGSPEEARMAAAECLHLFRATPGAVQRMQQLVGENPQYEAEYMDLF